MNHESSDRVMFPAPDIALAESAIFESQASAWFAYPNKNQSRLPARLGRPGGLPYQEVGGNDELRKTGEYPLVRTLAVAGVCRHGVRPIGFGINQRICKRSVRSDGPACARVREERDGVGSSSHDERVRLLHNYQR